MNSDSMVFIAFEERENLGIRYMAAVLAEAGYQVGITDFRKDKKDILEELIEQDPLIIGFSVIFDRHIYDFRDLIEYLRNNGIRNHFTAGGHFASLEPENLFGMIPSLDSVVRFEGEHTLLDLVNHLHLGKDWRKVAGISYKNNGKVVNNTLRALETDLDIFPFPVHQESETYVFDKKYVTLLAGRGCVHNCIFCDIREYYGQPPGPLKRIRNPVKVVEEMEYLHNEKECSVFLFQDDDFPVKTNRKSGWIEEFCDTLREKDLSGKIMWKINCRPDEIDTDIFELMRQHGLFRVYLGIEDGTDAGLLQMNKRIKASQILAGVNDLKKLGIGIDYGFMLFQPDTTYNSLNENLDFLKSICGDGLMPVKFLKMLPFLGTPIQKKLRKEGRLKGMPGFFDYDFHDRSLNNLQNFVFSSLYDWLKDPNGFSNISDWADIYISVFSYYSGIRTGIQQLTNELRNRVSDTNMFIIETLKELSANFQCGSYDTRNDKKLKDFKRCIEEKHNTAVENINRIIGKIELLYLTREFFKS